MTVKISYQQAVDLLELAVEERGRDFIYVRVGSDRKGNGGFCAYFDVDGSPSCIVGWVLNRLGIDWNQCNANDVNEAAIDSLINNEIIKVDFRTYTLLYIAQALQDSNVPWGRTLEIAKDCAEHIIVPDKSVEDWCCENDGLDYLAEEQSYDTEPIGFFRPNEKTCWSLPEFKKSKAPELVSEGVQTFRDDKGNVVTGEVFVEAY